MCTVEEQLVGMRPVKQQRTEPMQDGTTSSVLDAVVYCTGEATHIYCLPLSELCCNLIGQKSSQYACISAHPMSQLILTA